MAKIELVNREEVLAEIEKVYKDHYEQSYDQAVHDLYNAMVKRLRRAKTVKLNETNAQSAMSV